MKSAITNSGATSFPTWQQVFMPWRWWRARWMAATGLALILIYLLSYPPLNAWLRSGRFRPNSILFQAAIASYWPLDYATENFNFCVTLHDWEYEIISGSPSLKWMLPPKGVVIWLEEADPSKGFVRGNSDDP